MNQLNGIYWFNSLNTAAWSLIGVFIPVYFIVLGYQARDVYYFYLIYAAAILLFSVFSAWLVRNIGIKKTIFISYPLLFSFIAILYSLKELPQMFFPAAVIYAANVAFYCTPLHIFFASNSCNERIGANTGKLFAFQQIAGALGPLAGGAIAAFGGFKMLFILLAAVYSAGFLSFFWIKNMPVDNKLNIKNSLSLLRRYPRYAVAEIANSLQMELEEVVLPIFIFLAFGSIFSIGIIGFALSIGGAVFMLAIGGKSDKTSKGKLIITGGIIMSAIWLCRIIAASQVSFYALSLLAGFFGVLIYLPLVSYAYLTAKKGNIPEFIVFREFLMSLGRAAAFGLALAAGANFDWAFFSGALANFLFFAF